MTDMQDVQPSRRPSGISRLLAQPFFRLLAINWLIGAFAATIVLGGLLWLDTGGLRSLILASDQPWLPILVLLAGLMITLCSAAMGAAIMALPSEPGDDSGRRMRLDVKGALEPALAPMPVPVSVPARPRS